MRAGAAVRDAVEQVKVIKTILNLAWEFEIIFKILRIFLNVGGG